MRIAICDDEEFFVKELETKVNECVENEPGLKAQVDCYTDGKELLKAFQKEVYDLVYLDIEMGVLSGIDIANIIHESNPECVIIFITGYMDYVSESFLAKAFQYIQKPVKDEFFQSEFKRAISNIQLNKTSALFTLDQGNLVFNLIDIYYIETSYQNYILHTSIGLYKGPVKAIKNMKERLEDFNFYKIQRSYIINLNHIVEFSNDAVIMTDGAQLTISKKKLAEFKRILMNKKIG